MTGSAASGGNQGVVIRRYSGFYYVQDQSASLLECKLRGKAKDGVIMVGDRVRITPAGEGKAIIEGILPRLVELSRPTIANVDQVVVVMSFRDPVPNLHLLDRLLIMIEDRGLESIIVLNKCDLEESELVNTIKDYYFQIGYPVVLTSSKQGTGIKELAESMNGKINVVAGPSGVGKTSLLNALVPGHELKTGAISNKLGRGKHTTRHVELFPLEEGGWVADTPGFGIIDIPDMKREDLRNFYREFMGPSEDCRFSDCLHAEEVDCGVKEAVKSGIILDSRYQSYLAGLAVVIEKERCYK